MSGDRKEDPLLYSPLTLLEEGSTSLNLIPRGQFQAKFLVYLGIPALIACMCGIEFVLIVRSCFSLKKK